VPRDTEFVFQFAQDFLNEWEQLPSSRAYLQNVLFYLAAAIPIEQDFPFSDEMLLDWIRNLHFLHPTLRPIGTRGFLTFLRSRNFRVRRTTVDQVFYAVCGVLTTFLVALIVPFPRPDGSLTEGICHTQLTRRILDICSAMWSHFQEFRAFVEDVWRDEPERFAWFARGMNGMAQHGA
jgi:hypothetical protein